MTREEKIEAIYQEMANKELSFGCICKINDGEDVIFIRQNKTWSYLSIRENEEFTVSLWYTPEIIGHPVMIGDVLDRYKTNNNDYKVWGIDPYDLKSYSAFQEYDIKRLLNLWTGKRTPIDEQSDECINFVHSLIKKS